MAKKPIEDEDLRVFAKIKFDYNSTYIFPYEDGIEVMRQFKHAEQVDDSDYQNHKIVQMKRSPELSLLTNDAYTEMKMIDLLMPKDKEE